MSPSLVKWFTSACETDHIVTTLKWRSGGGDKSAESGAVSGAASGTASLRRRAPFRREIQRGTSAIGQQAARFGLSPCSNP